ncbi:HlyU family transcriptional regulator [Pokkaliibacter sp. CJK22405]|uniref:HlyU family transcriptional regulator n=1 Tax=Pokkaliibacter sp. CJK22405 TaxID=3384615 RepID=UPI0039852416
MGLLDSIAKLFGGNGSSGAVAQDSAEALEYKGFEIVPQPRKVGAQYGVGATISKEVDGERKEHYLIRSDQVGSRQDCIDLTVIKAKRTIDEQGERLFG